MYDFKQAQYAGDGCRWQGKRLVNTKSEGQLGETSYRSSLLHLLQ